METSLPLSALSTLDAAGHTVNPLQNLHYQNERTSTSLINLDLLLGNTDNVVNTSQLYKLFPFSIEITDKIIAYAYYMDVPYVVNEDNENDNSGNGKVSIPESGKNLTNGRFSNLNNLMLVNSGFHYLCSQYRYRYCKFIRSFSFSKFLMNLINQPELGDFVQYLDFQEFTAVGLGKSVESIFKIPNLTNVTLLKCLQLCSSNLKALLLSESVDTDISFEILSHIFNDMPSLKTLDFCGFSNDQLIEYFDQLEIKNDLPIENLSFHECLNFPTFVFDKIFMHAPNIKKLDLSHTQVTLKSLTNFLNTDTRLTHLSLKRCSQLGTFTEFINFLQHPAICGMRKAQETEEADTNSNANTNTNLNDNNGNQQMDIDEPQFDGSVYNLRWLNIQQCFSSETLSCERIDMILQILADGAPNLRYLNMNGFANINGSHIVKISESFPHLESLSVRDVNLNFSDYTDLDTIKTLNRLPQLKFLDVSASLYGFAMLKNVVTALDNVVMFEVAPSVSDNISHVFKIITYKEDTPYSFINDAANEDVQYWRAFNNKGSSRRSWIHRVQSMEDSKLYDNYENEISGSRLIEWDTQNGGLLLPKMKRLNVLGLACSKVDCCDDVGYAWMDSDFGNDLSVRGLYKYYSLNV